MKKNKNFNNGFTLVETLVAVAIFSVSILGLLSLLASSITNTTYAKEKIIAGYLAEEGVEYMRNLRDTYVLYSSSGQVGWNNFNTKVAGCATANGCYFDDSTVSFAFPSNMAMTNLTLTACSSSSCPNGALNYDSSTGKYGTSGSRSSFVRQILVKQISADEINVLSTVYWKQGSGTFSVTLSDNLFNWVH